MVIDARCVKITSKTTFGKNNKKNILFKNIKIKKSFCLIFHIMSYYKQFFARPLIRRTVVKMMKFSS